MNEEDEELVESTESVETLWQMAASENPQDEDLLYLMQGVGSDRDRKLTLAALLAWIVGKGGGVDAVLKSLHLNKSSGEANLKTSLDGEGVTLAADVSDGQGGTVEDPSKAEIKRLLAHYVKVNDQNTIKYDAYVYGDKIEITVTRRSDNAVIGHVSIEGGKIHIGNSTDGVVNIHYDSTNHKCVIDYVKSDTIYTEMLFSEDGLEIKKRAKFDRMNHGEVLTGSVEFILYMHNFSLAPKTGDSVVVENTSDTANMGVFIEPGLYVNVSPLCCMPFICVGSVTGQTGQFKWRPIGNATVSSGTPS